jgi:hypothetical protein
MRVVGELGLLLVVGIVLLKLCWLWREVSMLAVLALGVRVIVVECGLTGHLRWVHGVLGIHCVGI